MEKDGETAGKKLVRSLKAKGVEALVSSVLRWRKDLSWTLKGTNYCQMISDVNKEKLKFAQENNEMTFDDIIYTEETTLKNEIHRWMCSYKKGCKPRYKPKPKHPLKVHVWASISQRGKAGLCFLRGK